MAQKTIKVGDLVDIEFLDHAEAAPDAIAFRLTGEVQNITKTSYIIYTWRYSNPIDKLKDHNKDNENSFAIVKKAVLSIKKLR